MGIRIETFAVPGKVALFMEAEGATEGNFGTEEGDTIGLRVFDAEKQSSSFFYIPGCAEVDAPLKARLHDCDCLLFDGTVFTDNEMQQTGVGEKTGSRMGHMYMSGPKGSIAMLAEFNIARRIFVHINNTNPVLREGSAEEREVLASGWEISHDCMEIDL